MPRFWIFTRSRVIIPDLHRLRLEKSHPGVTAMFFQGAGADQNPLPRRTIPLARQYGKELAASVERVLE